MAHNDPGNPCSGPSRESFTVLRTVGIKHNFPVCAANVKIILKIFSFEFNLISETEKKNFHNLIIATDQMLPKFNKVVFTFSVVYPTLYLFTYLC
jgi:hypothetical protein